MSAGPCVVGESPHFLVQLPDRLLAVHNAVLPYFDNPAAVAADLPELRLREAVANHRAWVSVECLHADPASGPFLNDRSLTIVRFRSAACAVFSATSASLFARTVIFARTGRMA